MTLQDLLTKVSLGETTTLGIAGEPGTRTITVEARRLLPEEPRPPKREESPRREHTFYSAESLAAYLARYGTAKTVVFADPERETVHATLDETATAGFEVVTMTPQVHPLWKPWAAVAGQRAPLTDFVEFVAANRRAIVAPDGREFVFLLSQIRASVKTTLDQGRGKKAVNGIRIETEIQGVRDAGVVEIPDEVTLEVPLYVGTPARRIELDICLSTNREQVFVTVTAGTVAEARVKAFEDMLGVIRAGCAELGATFTLGAPAHEVWDYLQEMGAQK